jgi:cell division septation protein DedD
MQTIHLARKGARFAGALSTMRQQTDRKGGGRPRSGSVLVPVSAERCLSKRKTLERLTYIDLPSNNGGIVTDVSEGGLGFHAVAAVENGGPVHFSFSAGSHRIAGTGELIWTDAKRKIGGLRFTELPAEIREQIRSWPLESNLRLSAGKTGAADLPAATRSLKVPSILPQNADEPSEGPALSSYAPYFPEGLSPEALHGRRSSRLLRTIGISSLAGIFGVVSYFCYREAREWLAASKNSDPRSDASQRLAQGPAADSASGIALVSNTTAGRSETAGTVAPGGRSNVTEANVSGAAATVSAAPEAPQAYDANSPGPQVAVAHQTPPAEGEILFVQVAAYTNEADAFNLVNTLRGQDFVAFISPPVTDAYYRVQLGPYSSLEAAQIGKRELEKVGFKPFIRH